MELVTSVKTSHESGNLLMFGGSIVWINSLHELLHFGDILVNGLTWKLLVVIQFLLPHSNSGIISKSVNKGLAKGDGWLDIVLINMIPMHWIGCIVGLSFL